MSQTIPSASFCRCRVPALSNYLMASACGLLMTAKNGYPYTSVGRVLIEAGQITSDDMSLQTLAAWLRSDRERGRTAIWHNKSYVFFRELPDANEAVGVLGVALTPLRSLAIDPTYNALGTPIFIDAPAITHITGKPFRHLMVSQDVGSAIKGPARGDIYAGGGPRSGSCCGNYQTCRHLLYSIAAFRYRCSSRSDTVTTAGCAAMKRIKKPTVAKAKTNVAAQYLNDDERTLWSHVAASVQPIVVKARVTRRGALAEQEIEPDPSNASPRHPAIDDFAPVVARFPAAPNRPKSLVTLQPAEVEPRKVKRLSKGRSGIEARLDLHGLRQDEAHARLRVFVRECHARGLKFVLCDYREGPRRGQSHCVVQHNDGAPRTRRPASQRAPLARRYRFTRLHRRLFDGCSKAWRRWRILSRDTSTKSSVRPARHYSIIGNNYQTAADGW